MGKKRTPTEWLIEAVTEAQECDCQRFPPVFLLGLRGALEAGLSCEEIVASMVLTAGVYQAAEAMSGEELVERAKTLVNVMSGDLDEEALKRMCRLRRKQRTQRERSFKGW